MTTLPSLSVVMPVRDEAAHLDAAVESVLSQDYPGTLELVLAVAPSTDDTAEVAAGLAGRDRRVVVVDNPTRTTPAGLNRAIAAASGEVIARVDAHAELTPGYLRTAVEVLQRTGAANVGGVQRAIGDTPTQRAIAAAMSSRFGTGDARFHYGGPAGPVDTVYLGVFRAEVLHRLGGFDEQLLRNQDYELNIRIRRAGEVVWFDPRLEVVYRPRARLAGLAVQYWQYGRWKRVTLARHPGSLRWRQLAPPATVLANALGVLASLRWPRALAIPGAYLAGTLAAAAWEARGDRSLLPRLTAAFVTMHHAWGAGFLAGPPRSSRSAATPTRSSPGASRSRRGPPG